MSWDLNPLHLGRENVPVRRTSYPMSPCPGTDIDRMFNDFLNSDFPPTTMMNRDFIPSLDVSESDENIRVDCELPGIEQKDIELSLSGKMLSIKGEKKTEEESRHKGMYRSERRYGSFLRTVELPNGLDLDKTAAEFHNGLLRITIPKTDEYKKQTRSIPVHTPESGPPPS
ncbi:MAG TPA: Hsp20/alpha crystallin family protein [Candidatus Obscuribacterales bacterium]